MLLIYFKNIKLNHLSLKILKITVLRNIKSPNLTTWALIYKVDIITTTI